MDITPEVIKALAFLRKYPPVEVSVHQALDVLDNAGIFAPIDEATGYDVESTCTCPSGYDFINGGVSAQHRPSCPEAPVSKCTCPRTYGGEFLRMGHRDGCPGDPAEYGDMAYKVAPEGRRYCPADQCTLHFKVNKDGTLHKHLNDMLEPCLQGAAEGAQPQTVQCSHCRGDYKPKKDGTLRKHSCWSYDETLKTIVYGALDIHGRATPATGWANPQTLAQKISDIH